MPKWLNVSRSLVPDFVVKDPKVRPESLHPCFTVSSLATSIYTSFRNHRYGRSLAPGFRALDRTPQELAPLRKAFLYAFHESLASAPIRRDVRPQMCRDWKPFSPHHTVSPIGVDG